MAMNDEQKYEAALKAFGGDETRAKKFIAAQAGKAPATPTPQRRMASADKPAGGSVGTKTVKAVTPGKEPKVELPAGDAYMPSPGAARMEDRADLNGAKAYGVWASEEAERKEVRRAATPGTPENAERRRVEAANYYGPAVTKANAQIARDTAYGARQVVRALTDESVGPAAPPIRRREAPPGDAYMDTPTPMAAPPADDRAYLLSLGATPESLAAYDAPAIARMAATQRAKAAPTR